MRIGAAGMCRVLGVVLATTGVACGQQGDAVSPYHAQRMEEYVAYTALWRTDNSFHSTIKVANQLATAEIDAIPTLYMADGTAWDLPPMHLGKSAVEVLDVNAALAQAPDNIRPHMSEYGSAAIRYHYDWQGAVYATVSILNLARSLEYNYPFIFPPNQGKGETYLPASTRIFRDSANSTRYEGLWFRNSRSTGGFLAFANVGNSTLNVHVTLSGMRSRVNKEISIAPHNTEMVNLQDLFIGDDSRAGGITVAHSGRKGDLQLAGGLEDVSTGYSTNLPFAAPVPALSKETNQAYASPGMMVNEQDQMLNFPPALYFHPYAFFRNVSAATRVLHSQIYYMEGKGVRAISIPDLTLRAGEAKELSIHDLMKARPEVTDMTLLSSYTGNPGDILSATGSTDSSGSYVFPVIAEPVARSGTKKFAYWQFGGGFDTMYSIWNPLPTSQNLLTTISYGDQGKTYKLPITLNPHASTMVDIGEIERSQLADRDGNTVPLTAQFGSFEISDPSESPEALITAVVSSGIYNPRKGTCGQGCETCAGITGWTVSPVLSVVTGSSQQAYLTYTDNGGTQHGVTSLSQWLSQSTGIATVQTTGQANPGMSTGVTAGSTQIGGWYYATLPVNAGQICSNLPLPACPTYGSIGGYTPISVNKNLPLLSSTCTYPSPSLGAGNFRLEGSWGTFGGCVLSDYKDFPGTGSCSGDKFNTTPVNGHWQQWYVSGPRSADSACQHFTDHGFPFGFTQF